MSKPRLPPEILDYVVDLLHDELEALKGCSLVSGSWIPRARKHLFAKISFNTGKDLESWKKMFPDPKTSPGSYTRTLTVGSSHAVMDVEADGWIQGFSRVVSLVLKGQATSVNKVGISPDPRHKFSPIVKSARMGGTVFLSSQIFGLIHSFPLLDDLAVLAYGMSPYNGDGSDGLSTVIQPSGPPRFTGSMSLDLRTGMDPVVRRLLSLPGGIRFRKFTLRWLHEEEVPLITKLVEGCSRTLESLNVTRGFLGTCVRSTRAPKLVNSISS